MVDIDRITTLTVKYMKGTLSAEEEAELEQWRRSSETNERRFKERISEENIIAGLVLLKQGDEAREADRSKIKYPTTKIVALRPSNRRVYVAAAAVIFLIGSGIFLLLNRRHTSEIPQVLTTNADILPGGNRAVLTLSDGRQVNLDSSANGVLASQGNTRVKKLANGQLAYEKNDAAGEAEKKLVFNTLTIPRGGQYALVLPDGSRVWLNSQSSLRYPVSFSGPARIVELDRGEAYFEIAKDPSKPFLVQITPNKGNPGLVQVLGTSFNVKAYEDEKEMQTTLLDGTIKFSVPVPPHTTPKEVTLKPGEQAVVPADNSPGSPIAVKDNVNTDGVIAWKNGHFHFENADIKSVMQELARWYDVEDVEYVEPLSTNLFSGDIQRKFTLNQVAEFLGNNIHLKIAKRKITVLP